MLYDEIMKIVTLAGELMLQAQDEELTVFDKEGTANFVTKHDKEIQFYLIQNLRQLIPEATFLAEEDGMQQELGDGYCFIIDPIDGTTNFIFDYKHSLGIRAGGSAALDICRVASGANGVYLELMLYPWDYAAASLIVMEAGGFISTAEGGMITLDQPCSILAAGRQCWKEASQLLSE